VRQAVNATRALTDLLVYGVASNWRSTAFVGRLSQAKKEFLQLLSDFVTVDFLVNDAFLEAGRNEREGRCVHRFTNSRHLRDNVLARSSFFKHPHYGTHLAVGSPNSLGYCRHLRFVSQYMWGFLRSHSFSFNEAPVNSC